MLNLDLNISTAREHLVLFQPIGEVAPGAWLIGVRSLSGWSWRGHELQIHFPHKKIRDINVELLSHKKKVEQMLLLGFSNEP